MSKLDELLSPNNFPPCDALRAEAERELTAVRAIASEGRKAGREEALQILMRISAEDAFDDARACEPLGDTGEYSTTWIESKLREIFDVLPGATQSLIEGLEGAYWDMAGQRDEAREFGPRSPHGSRLAFGPSVAIRATLVRKAGPSSCTHVQVLGASHGYPTRRNAHGNVHARTVPVRVARSSWRHVRRCRGVPPSRESEERTGAIRMSRVFVIADLHLGHEKLALARGFSTIEEHDAAIVEAWNRVITKRDVVYVLGDVFRTHHVSELRGTKKLAMGNHDGRARAYLDLFSQVTSYFEFDRCILSHIPVHPSQFPRWTLNVHGHTHARALDDRRYVATSVEQCPRMAPMLLRELIEARTSECLSAGIIEAEQHGDRYA